jgi:pilus assembly protein Flp/PilA
MHMIIGFLRNSSGATAIEYAMLASGVATVTVAAVNHLGSAVDANYTSVSVALK